MLVPVNLQKISPSSNFHSSNHKSHHSFSISINYMTHLTPQFLDMARKRTPVYPTNLPS
jgi:hypothetical protein